MAFLTEADTCRLYVLPKLYAAAWADEQISEQKSFTDGRIVVAGTKVKRRPQKRADYLLRYRRDFPIAVVEAKSIYATSGDGLQQAKEYAQILDLKFAYATNGRGIVEHDFLTGRDNNLADFSSADDLWGRLRASEGIDEKTAERVLAPYYHLSGKTPRYYQEIAINRVVQGILQGKRRILLTLATGTGKTVIAFQISYKLWSSRWNRAGEHRRPRILYLADRNILVDDPKDKRFAPFGDARWKISGEVRSAIELVPSNALAHGMQGVTYLCKSQYQPAVTALHKSIQHSQGASSFVAALGETYAEAGSRDKAHSILEQLQDLSKQRYVTPYIAARLNLALGKKDEALGCLEASYRSRDSFMVFLNVDPRLDDLRPKPRFQDLMHRMNFPA